MKKPGCLGAVAGVPTAPHRARSETGPSPQVFEMIPLKDEKAGLPKPDFFKGGEKNVFCKHPYYTLSTQS
jgi:hypothetical protein